MFRTLVALFALMLGVSVADAQARPLPLSPGISPGSPWGPGMPLAPTRPIPPGRTPKPSNGFVPISPYGYGFGYGYPFYSPFGYGYGFGLGSDYGLGYPFYNDYDPLNNSVPALPAATTMRSMQSETSVITSNEFSAMLTVQLPTAGEVWLDGKKVSSKASEEQVLVSPVLTSNQQYKFNVKAQWTHKGKTYESSRVVTVGAGDRSRLMIVSGDEVSK